MAAEHDRESYGFPLWTGVLVAMVVVVLLWLVVGAEGKRTAKSAVVQRGVAQSAVSLSYLPLLEPYPPPEPTFMPTATAVPLGQYYPIPAGVQHEVVSLQTAPDSYLLSNPGRDGGELAGSAGLMGRNTVVSAA